jgi:hypothetical protein
MEAVGTLGGAVQLAPVAARLSPAVESKEGPREAAWTAFCAICKRLPLADQVAAADRLTEYPQGQVDYLRQLYDSLVGGSAAPPEFYIVGERLARLYSVKGRHVEALPVWRLLHGNAQKSGLAQASDYVASLLACVLVCNETTQIVDVLQSMTTASETQREAAAVAVVEYLKQATDSPPAEEVEELVIDLELLPLELFPALSSYLDTLHEHTPEAPETQPSHSD